ncbi:TMEM175 family protein [Ferruginibacter profundus]
MNTSPGIQQQKETIRIETFSDGIFCIAVTLLSIEIGIEVEAGMTNKSLTIALLHKWPILLAYVTSFINVLLAWIGHHSLFKKINTTNSFVMISNGVLLMLVALVPFPTKTLGLFLLTGAFKTAAIFYTGYFVLISLAFRLLWFAAASKRSLLVQEITEQEIKTFTKNENLGLLCNSIIMAVAFFSPWTALALSFVMWIYWIAMG